MQLTGKSIKERGIVTNLCDKAVQQQGVDVRIENVYSVTGGGMVPRLGKTILPDRTQVHPTIEYEYGDREVFELEPGYYEVDLMEKCKIPNNMVLNYKTRSSLVRCGAIVHSGQFDAGFETERMGCFLEVTLPIVIEVGSRIAQAVVMETEEVESEDLYNGQFQKDKQRK